MTMDQISNFNRSVNQKRKSCTLESAQPNKRRTLKATPLKPYWNDVTKDWSRRLLSCTKTDCHELQPTCWNSSLSKQASNSWFTVRAHTLTSSTTLPMSSSPSQPTLLQAIMGNEPPNPMPSENKSEKFMRARRIRVYPTKQQESKLDNWFGAVRFVYNQAVQLSQTKDITWEDLTLKALREQFMTNPPEWAKGIPYAIRDNALRDFDKARKAFFAKRRKAKKSNPDANPTATFKFKSKRAKQQCMEVPHQHWGRTRGMFADLFGPGKIHSKEAMGEVKNDFRVIRYRFGHYYFCLPRESPIRSESQAPTLDDHVVSLDPGVRTFQTCYSATGLVTEWGKDDMNLIFQECYAADRLQGRLKRVTGSKRYKRRMAWLRKLVRIQDKIKEVHRKLAVWLCENHRIVLIPNFETQQMIRRKARKLRSKTARGMCCWSHYAFRQLLLNKADLFPWCRIIVCDEAYTSKTCGGCGLINDKLGSNKTFNCKSCGYQADRDISAARNILLRYLTLNS